MKTTIINGSEIASGTASAVGNLIVMELLA
jgi:hypothetical protein